jgi:lipopolysaccharide transport system ATP-binding protein
MGSIQVSNVGKAYKQYHRRWDRLLEWISPTRTARHTQKWVLRDISFMVEPGEAIGIIGVNGAGKSTLLKMITGTTQPTTGAIAVRGKVAALLELGMGFHPEFTGRQNVFMAGQLLGYSVAEIEAHMAGIEAFAEIGAAIDEPVRVYSSGMQLRLAFSVATAIRPDILIVDEALAVGDVYFQQKCFERIEGFVRSGTTLLFVSHSTGTVLNLCSRAILLKAGVIAHDGLPKDVIDLYQAELLVQHDRSPEQLKLNQPDSAEEPAPPAAETERVEGKVGSLETGVAECTAVRLLDQDGDEAHAVLADQQMSVLVTYRVERAVDDPHVGFKLRNRFGVVLFETNSYCMGQTLGPMAAGTVFTARFDFAAALFPDEYTITVGLGNGGYGEGSFREVLNYMHEVKAFTVVRNPAAIVWSGMINLQPRLEFAKTEATGSTMAQRSAHARTAR